MIKIYIECGTTLKSKFYTGIQRTVISIINNATEAAVDLGVEINFVEFNNGEFVFLSPLNAQGSLAEVSPPTWIYKIGLYLRGLLPIPLFNLLIFLVHPTYSKAINFRSRIIQRRKAMRGKRCLVDELGLSHKENGHLPILILLDSSWNNAMWPAIKKLRMRGFHVCSVLYDLIPFFHPETVLQHTLASYCTWWNKVPENVDSVICISESVKKEFLEWQDSMPLSKKIAEDKTNFFHLGAELKSNDVMLKVLFLSTPYFIVVGSFEPRKNLQMVLNAFEILWANGLVINLVIVYSHTWKSEDLLSKMKGHSELGQRLFLINDASDRDLVMLYIRANALIMASIAEGFGLPVVEALKLGVKVICSDISIFREVAGEHASYFSLNSETSLSDKIIQLSSQVINPISPPSPLVNWITWQESTRQLLERVILLAKD